MCNTEPLEIKNIINAFKNNKNEILSSLYLDIYPLILKLVKSNSGTESDAKDVLQDAFLIVYTKISNDNFKLSCSFNTYIYSICRNLWLKQLRNSRTFNLKFVDITQIEDMNYQVSIEHENRLNDQYFTYRKHLHGLSKLCKDILTLFLEKKSYVEIALELGLVDHEYARKKKYRCKQALINRIKTDPNFNDLLE